MAVRVAMVAGEASGDQLGAHLVAALRRHLPDAQFFGIGGPRMEQQGFEARWPAAKLAVHGYAEALRHYREISAIRRKLRRQLLRERPDVFVGIDAPDFNLGLEADLKRRGIATVHYVSPSIWAWRGGRVKRIARSVDHMLCLFPFEPALYERRGVAVSYVGHPLADTFALEPDQVAVRERLELAPDRLIFALLPGSRRGELEHLGGLFVEAAVLLHERFPDAQFLVPFASRETRDAFAQRVRERQIDLPLRLMFGHAHDALAACDAALVASGTATLEAALMKRPMVIAYRMAALSWQLMKRMAYLPYAGLPNILAGRFVVPEFIQDEATAENLAQALGNLVSDSLTCARLRVLFEGMHLELKQNSAERAAQAILPYVRHQPTWTTAHQTA